MSNEMETTQFDARTDLTALPVNGADPSLDPQALLLGGVVIDPTEGRGILPGGGIITPSLPGPPVIFSVQPSPITAGGNRSVTLSGQNLPADASKYKVIDRSGAPAPGIFVLSASGLPSLINLVLSVSPFVPADLYRIRVENLGFASEAFLQISATTTVPILSSISPVRIAAGTTSTVTAFGANLPAGAGNYSVVDSFGSRVAGVQVVSATGSGAQVNVQLSVSASAPLGGFFFRVEVTGAAAQLPLEIFQGGGAIVLFSVSPNTLAVGRITRITLAGSNLPLNAAFYSLRSGVTGTLIRATFALVTGATNGSSVTLNVALPTTAPRGQAFLRVETFDRGAAEIPVFIV